MLATTAQPDLNKPRIPPRPPERPVTEAFITPAAFKLSAREPLAFLLIAGRIVGLSP